MLLIWFLSRRQKIVLPTGRWMRGKLDLVPLAALAFCFSAATVSGLLGLSEAYGAFLAGLVIGQSTDRAATIRATRPIQSVLLVVFFLFYLTLDLWFAIAFLVAGFLMEMLAARLGALPGNTGWIIAAACFFGGYIAQFVGHAVEKSMPVLVKHPIQANLAAPFFTVVEMFKILGLRDDLFNQVQAQITNRREEEAGAA